MSHYHHLSSTGKAEINFNDESVKWVKEYKLLYTSKYCFILLYTSTYCFILVQTALYYTIMETNMCFV